MRPTRKIVRTFGFLFVLATLPLTRTAVAEDCDCSRYASLYHSVSLANQVADIGLRSIQQDGRIFAAAHESPAVLKQQSLKLIPAHCYAVLQTPKPLTLVMRGSTAGPPRFDTTQTPARKLLDGYEALEDQYMDACTKTGKTKEEAESCLKLLSHFLYSGFGAQLTKNPPNKVIEDAKTSSPSNPIAIFNESEVRTLQHYHTILNSKSGAAALDYIRSIRNSLSIEQRLSIVQMFGARFLENYDKRRTDGGSSPVGGNGPVTLDHLLGAARHNTTMEAYNEHVTSRLNEEGKAVNSDDLNVAYAGVCRDIASAQGEMLEAFGFKNTYIITVATTGSGHATVITQNPNNPKKLYHLNYGTRNDPAAGDTRALWSSPTDAGINYRIYKPGGRIVQMVLSEFGKFVSEAAGFDVQSMDPLARTHGSLIAANYSVGPSQKTSLRLGHGSDGMAAEYTFAGMTQDYALPGGSPGRVGIVLGTQNRSTSPAFSKPGYKDSNLDFLYTQIQQKFRSGEVKLTENLQARIEAEAILAFVGYRERASGNTSAGPVLLEWDARGTAGVHINQNTWRDQFFATYKVGAQVIPGRKDVRDFDRVQGYTLAINHLFLNAEGRLRLSSTAEGRAFLVAATTVLANELGIRGRAEIGVFTDHVGATLQWNGRLTNDTAMFLDGTGRTLSGNIYWSPEPNIKVSASATAPLEKDLPLSTGLMGNLSVQY